MPLTIFAVSDEAIIKDYMREKSLEDALCYYIGQHDLQLVRKVVEMGADVNKIDYYGNLPLYEAVCCDHFSSDINAIVDFILSKGANPYLTHQKGISVMELFKMSDRSYFKDTFKKYGYTIPEYCIPDDAFEK